MFRTAWVTLVAIIATLTIGTLVLVIAAARSTSPAIDRLIRLWARLLVRAAGIDLQAANTDHLDASRRYILVANHGSYFDIPFILAAIPQPTRFMAKVSLFQIPIFGWAIKRAGFIPIDRKNRRTAVKSLELAGERIRKGNTIVVFPEEGRSLAGELRTFQRGGFLLALRSGLPVVPIAIDGNWNVFPVGARTVTPGLVTVRVGTPIETTSRSVRDKEALATEARQQIATMLGIAD